MKKKPSIAKKPLKVTTEKLRTLDEKPLDNSAGGAPTLSQAGCSSAWACGTATR